MRLSAILVGALALVPGALAVGVEKSILVTYNREAPSVNSMVDQAKAEIIKAGGVITHTYNIIHGFHAIVTEDVVDNIKKWGGSHVTVEEDSKVTISNGRGRDARD